MKRLKHAVSAIGALCIASTALAAESSNMLEQQSKLWQQSNSSHSYTYILKLRCECELTRLSPAVVEVEDGQVQSVRLLSNPQLAGSDLPAEFKITIEEIFARLLDARAKDAILSVVYHPRLGYPLYAHIDYCPDWFDDELEIQTMVLGR